MKSEQLRSIARPHSLKPSYFSRAQWINAAHGAEGNFARFTAAHCGECVQANCMVAAGLF